jgi:hypothetical protein
MQSKRSTVHKRTLYSKQCVCVVAVYNARTVTPDALINDVVHLIIYVHST